MRIIALKGQIATRKSDATVVQLQLSLLAENTAPDVFRKL